MKKSVLLTLFVLVALAAHAQWKVVGCDKESSSLELKQIIQTDEGTAVYGQLHSTDTLYWSVTRDAYVKAEGKKYKIKSTVNFPLKDEAEPRYLVSERGNHTYNFIAVFEKFPAENGFDYVNSPSEEKYTIQGVKVEPITEDQVIPADDYLNETPVTIYGKSFKDGETTSYLIHNGVKVTCKCTQMNRGFMEPNSYEYYINIYNDTDHGVRFDFNKVRSVAYVTKKGKEVAIPLALYSPSSYEGLKQSEDYEEAKRAVGGSRAVHEVRAEAEKMRPGWGKVGGLVVADILAKQQQNHIEEYLLDHKNDRPGPMQTTSIYAGETYGGYIASKSKKSDRHMIFLTIDGYEFGFSWK